MRACDMPWFVWSCLLALFLSGCKPSGEVQVDFPVRHPALHEKARALEQDRKTLGKYTPTGCAQSLAQAFFRFNQATVTARQAPGELEQAMRQVRAEAMQCLEKEGPGALTKLSLWLLRRFEHDLGAVLAVSRKAGAATALLSGEPLPEEIQDTHRKFAEVGGDFLVHAAQAGLIRPARDGGVELAEGDAFYVRLAFKVHFARILPEATHPLDFFLSEFERRWYDIWVAERSRTAGLFRKLHSIDRLAKQDRAYPAHAARGIVLYRNKKYPEAVQSFHKALKLHPGDGRLKSFLKAAQSRAR